VVCEGGAAGRDRVIGLGASTVETSRLA